jgi:hypothetical protein
MTLHICIICNRKHECMIYDCDLPIYIKMNCGVEKGTPYHEEQWAESLGDNEI